MKVSYYPGCTLKTKARNLDRSAVESLAVLGVELAELPRWNCCGAVFSLADDDLLHLLAPVRDLIRTKEQGDDKVLVACSMCYNTLARANLVMRENEEKRHTINSFMEEEQDYNGEVEVVHLLPFLRDHVGWDAVRAKVKRPLTGLKVGTYYGCTLVRPKEVSIEPPGGTGLLTAFLEALGATPVIFPAYAECCSSYQVISHPDLAADSSFKVLDSARQSGADALISSCPLCEYNLGRRQAAIASRHEGFVGLPTFYFTQLMAVAFGLGEEVCHFELSPPESRSLLQDRNLLAGAAL
jgi:heterodisulfide reductase subunit B